MFFFVKTKFGDPLLRIARANSLQDANGNHVFRFGQAFAHAHGAFESAVVVFGFPWLATRDACIKEQG